MVKVKNSFGVEIDFDAAVELMDDELREEIAEEFAPCSEQKFFDEYAKAHNERFLGWWEPDTRCPQM